MPTVTGTLVATRTARTAALSGTAVVTPWVGLAGQFWTYSGTVKAPTSGPWAFTIPAPPSDPTVSPDVAVSLKVLDAAGRLVGTYLWRPASYTGAYSPARVAPPVFSFTPNLAPAQPLFVATSVSVPTSGSAVWSVQQYGFGDVGPAANSSAAPKVPFGWLVPAVNDPALTAYDGAAVPLAAPPAGPAGPANDLFARPTVLRQGSSTVPFTTVGATSEPGEPASALAAGLAPIDSVWFVHTARASGQITLDLHSSEDLMVEVFTGGTLAGLQLVKAQATKAH